MALSATRYEYRIALSHVDAGVQEELTLVAARHPSETAEHLSLRVLAHCLLMREGIGFGPGLSDGDASDLEARDAMGRVSLWVECGAVEAGKLKKVVQANAGAEVHVVLGDERRRRELLEGVAALPHGIKDKDRVTLWRISPALVTSLAAHEDRRQKWSLTIVGGHLYVEVDGEHLDGEASSGPLEGDA